MLKSIIIILAIILCMQDALSRCFTDISSEPTLKVIAETMNEGFAALHDMAIFENITVELLEGLAKLRFSLSVVADVLQKQSTSKQNIIPGTQTQLLVHTAQNVCSDLQVNVIDTSGHLDTTGPIIYLMRLLVRQYGMPCLEKVAIIYSWIIPTQLKSSQEVNED